MNLSHTRRLRSGCGSGRRARKFEALTRKLRGPFRNGTPTSTLVANWVLRGTRDLSFHVAAKIPGEVSSLSLRLCFTFGFFCAGITFLISFYIEKKEEEEERRKVWKGGEDITLNLGPWRVNSGGCLRLVSRR